MDQETLAAKRALASHGILGEQIALCQGMTSVYMLIHCARSAVLLGSVDFKSGMLGKSWGRYVRGWWAEDGFDGIEYATGGIVYCMSS